MKLFLHFKPQMFVFFLIFGLLFNAFIRGYNPQDEGWVLYGAWRIFEGDIPYKHFQYLYTPLSAFLGAMSFFLFDVSILSQRILALFIASTVSVFLYNFFQDQKIPKIVSLLLIGVFVVWGPLHANYLSPAIIAVELGIVYVYFLAKSLSAKPKPNPSPLLLAGITSMLIILTKQTYGAAIILHVVFLGGYLLIHKYKKPLFFLFFGAFLPSAIFTLYLVMTGSFYPFFAEMYSFLILDAASGGFSYHTPLTYPAPFLYKIAKITLYSLPLGISTLSLYFEIKKKSKIFLIPILTTLFFFVGIQPVFDTIHLSPLIAVSSICIGLLFTRVNSRKLKMMLIFLSTCLLIVGIYNGIFRNYYKWFAPLNTSNALLASPKAKILIHQEDAKIINTTVDYLTSQSGDGEYIFNYGMTPILYFLAQRVSPSRFITIETRNVQGKNLELLLHDLRINTPKLIISDGDFRGINPRIESFILRNYLQIATISGRPVYKLSSF